VGPTAPLALGLTWMHRESLPKAAYVNVFCLLYSYAQDVTTVVNKERVLKKHKDDMYYDKLA